jgi:parvulin-like peptidyl-prolyl isomerase
VRELEKQGGRQVLDNLISEALIVQEARKAGIVITEADIDAKAAEVKEQLSSQGQDLDSLLATQGMSQERFRYQIKTQLYIEKLLKDKIEITDEQINQFIETNKSFLPTDLDEEGLKNLARQELTQQGLSSQFSVWIAEVKKNSNINYFVQY